MFKIIPWRVTKFKNQHERLFRIIEILKELDHYDIEVDYETDSNNNENIIFWLMCDAEPKEMIDQR